MLNNEDLLLSIDDAVWHMELPEKRFSYINHKLGEICERPVSEIQANPDVWNDLIHPEDKSWVLEMFKEALQGNKIDIDYRIVCSHSIKWVNHKESLVVDADSKKERLIGSIRDISLQRNKEIEITESEKLYKYLFQSHPNPIWIYDQKTLKFLAVNDAAVISYGYSKDEFMAMDITRIRPEEDIPLLEKMLKFRRSEMLNTGQWRHKKKDGTIIWVSVSGHQVDFRGLDARIIQAIDITATRQAQELLMKEKQNLDSVINNTKDLIWSIDRNYNLISANKSFRAEVSSISGVQIEEGDDVFVNLTEQEKKSWLIFYDKALNGETYSFVEQLSPDKLHEVTLSPILNETGEIIGASCFVHDITEYISSQSKILRQNENLREIAQLAAHDIRGPVTSIIGLMNVINKDNPADPENAELLHYMADATRQLDSVIHKIVDKTYEVQREANGVTPSRN